MHRKKEIERWHLERFKDAYPLFPTGRTWFDDEPDMYVQTQKGILGIEHTRLIRETFRAPRSKVALVPKEQESLQGRIVNRAWDIFRKTAGPSLIVNVRFDDSVKLSKKDVPVIAEKLAQLVRHIPLSKLEGSSLVIHRQYYNHYHPGAIPQAIQVVYIFEVEKDELSSWAHAGGGVVPSLSAETIREEINKKDKLVGKYRKKCDAVWLVVVEEGPSLSSYFEIPDETVSRTYHSEFDKVFLFRNHSSTVYQLKV
jgi:hypothetical protein